MPEETTPTKRTGQREDRLPKESPQKEAPRKIPENRQSAAASRQAHRKKEYPHKFHRYKAMRPRRPRKRFVLGKGALAKVKVKTRQRSQPPFWMVDSMETGILPRSQKAKKTGAVKRSLDDGKKLVSSGAPQQRDDSPERYAVDAVEEKAGKAANIVLDEVSQVVKDKLLSKGKEGKKETPQPEREPDRQRKQEKSQESKDKPSDKNVPDKDARSLEIRQDEDLEVEKKPDKDLASRRASAVQRHDDASASGQGGSTAVPTQTAGYYPISTGGGAKLQTLDGAMAPDDTRSLAKSSNTLHTNSNPSGGEEDDAVLGGRYHAPGDNHLAEKPRDIATSETMEDTSPPVETVPQHTVSAYDFHPDYKTLHTDLDEEFLPDAIQPTEKIPAQRQSSELGKTQAGKGQSLDTKKVEAPRRAGAPDSGTAKPGASAAKRADPKAVQSKAADKTIQVGGKAQLQTWQSSQVTMQLNNQLPALASAQGGASVQAFAHAGQAMTVMQGGGAAAGAAAGAATGGIGFAAQAGMMIGQKIVEQIKGAIESAAAKATQSAKSWGTGTALLLVPLLLVLCVICVFRLGGSATNVGLSENVIALMPKINEACQRHGIPEYAPLVAAVIMQESGGNVDLVNGDVMQCAEGMGYPVGTPVPVDESIDFGTQLLAGLLQKAGAQGPADISHISLALQSYNFGGGYLTWALKNYGGYSKENALEFSQQQAAAMGWAGYGDPDYVDHVLRYYQVTQGGMGDRSAIANGFFAYPFPGHTWTTYAGHEGIDISFAGIEGQPVYAAAPGTVTLVRNGYSNMQGAGGLLSYGNCVFINHGNGWESRYAHMTVAVAQQGQYVQEGQLIGYVGNTGNSYGAHLHLALYYNGSPSSGGVIYAEQAWPWLKE